MTVALISAFRPLAVVRDYDGLHAALRARADELSVSRGTIDGISSLADGYAAKLLGPSQVKCLGPISTGPILEALGVLLIVAENPEALAKFENLRVRRRENCVRAARTAVRQEQQR